jgi:hypothetical protein
MTLESVQHNWRMFRVTRLAATAFGLLLMSTFSYTQTAPEEFTREPTHRTATRRSAASGHVTNPPLPLQCFGGATCIDLRRRVATKWPEGELVSDATQGVELATMQQLASYRATDYDSSRHPGRTGSRFRSVGVKKRRTALLPHQMATDTFNHTEHS